MEDLQYPIGRFHFDAEPTAVQIERWIQEIADLPSHLQQAVAGLQPSELDIPYRSGGWTIRQVVHHLADSHMNSFMRFKLALTEDEPTIKPYEEALWAELADSKTAPIDPSLSLLTSLHHRWVLLLRSLTPEDFTRTYVHPARGKMTLTMTLGLYAWHGKHHVAHITSVRNRLAE